MTSLLSLAIAMFAGLMMTRAVKRLHLPDVTAYLVAGVLIGPCCIGALHIPGIGFASYDQLENIGLICDVALGFIAFSIGNEFRLSQLKETGRQAFIIGVIIVTMVAVYMRAQLGNPAELLSYVIVPVVYLSNILVFSAFYYMFTFRENM